MMEMEWSFRHVMTALAVQHFVPQVSAYRLYGLFNCLLFVTVNILEEFSSTIPRARQDIRNVICLDTGQQPSSRIILLHGCPSQGYFATNQSTVGVCYEDTQDMRDLLLKPSTMVTGLHSFICLLGSNQFLYTYAIACKLNNSCKDTY